MPTTVTNNYNRLGTSHSIIFRNEHSALRGAEAEQREITFGNQLAFDTLSLRRAGEAEISRGIRSHFFEGLILFAPVKKVWIGSWISPIFADRLPQHDQTFGVLVGQRAQ